MMDKHNLINMIARHEEWNLKSWNDADSDVSETHKIKHQPIVYQSTQSKVKPHQIYKVENSSPLLSWEH